MHLGLDVNFHNFYLKNNCQERKRCSGDVMPINSISVKLCVDLVYITTPRGSKVNLSYHFRVGSRVLYMVSECN